MKWTAAVDSGSITSTSSFTFPPLPHVPFAFIYSQCSCLSVLARQGNKSCKIWVETCLIFRKKYSCWTYWMSSTVNTCNKRWWTFASTCKVLLASSNPYPSPAMGDFFQRASPAKTLLWLKKKPSTSYLLLARYSSNHLIGQNAKTVHKALKMLSNRNAFTRKINFRS